MYNGQKVSHHGKIWMLLTAPKSNLWQCRTKDGTLGEFSEDFLVPILKPGDTVEATIDFAPILNGTYTLVEKLTEVIWECKQHTNSIDINEFWLWPTQSNSCTCDIMQLMAYGCKCGQIERESKWIR
jgi:hypothetical protein